ncbi:MAG TPA: PAS domain S-box protein [Polyangiaceae bacterium]|nr:PAS domain S-box protein [Polyangiaceae bacterium]
MPTPNASTTGLLTVPALSWDDCGQLVESIVGHAILMLDIGGHVATWNRAAEKMTGYAAAETIGTHHSKFYPPEQVAAGKPNQDLNIASEAGRIEQEGWRIRKDGSRFRASIVITALRDEVGKLRGFAEVTRDLTAKPDEDHDAEQRFHLLVDAITDYAIFILDPTGRISTWNPGAERLKGYAADEIVGQHFSIFYTPEDHARGKPQQVLETVRREGRYEDESWRVRKDGSLFWANVVITALRDTQGSLIGFAKVTRDLSGRRSAEEELRRSEERFRLLVESVGDYAIYMLDPEGRVTTWNLGAARMKGYTAHEVIGKNFAIFFNAEDAAAGKPARELARARTEGRCEDEGWRVRKDGRSFWANAILTALRDDKGELIGFAKITRDLTIPREAEATERQLFREQMARSLAEDAERRVRESEERYRDLSQRLEIILQGVADGITVQERSGRVVFANNAAARICGFESVDELIKTSPADVFARFEILDEHHRPLQPQETPSHRVLAGKQDSGATLHIRERGSPRGWWTRVRSSAVFGADGKPELAVTIWHDVTVERRHDVQAKYLGDATAALGASLRYEEMFGTLARVLVPGLGDWCSIYLRDGEELRNVAIAHIDGTNLPNAQEQPRKMPTGTRHSRGLWSVVSSGEAALYNDITDQMLVEVARDPAHLDALRGVGLKAALLAPIRVRSQVIGAISLVFAESDRRYDESDVTVVEELGRRAGVAFENSQLYKSAQDAARVAEEASRAKDEFLATVSHELRTPLTAIVGWSSLLKSRVSDPTVAKSLEAIYRNAQSQVKIIDDILDVSRVITGKFLLEPRPADIVAIAREAIEVVRPSALAKKIDIVFMPRTELCLLVADPERLQQVVWNLLSNAVRFTDGGGNIRIAVGQEASTVVLSVKDTGKGIDAAFLPFVFDRFKQADSSITRRVGGLGLGLALVRHIVELHGGQVAAASDGPGTGATFTIRLPIRAMLPASETPLPAPVSVRNAQTVRELSGIRVLAVDDEPDARDLIGAVLEQAGAVVETAPSAALGFEAFKRFRPDVLVSDIGMPDEDGFTFMRRIRALSSAEGGKVPSLALTAFASEEDRGKAIGAGYTTHLGKPVSPDALATAVANLAAVTSGAG